MVHSRASLWVSFALVAAAVGVVPQSAQGQLAPVAGAHYAARASDTGFSSGADGGGGYSASVPLDFSPVDGSVPVPISVVYNGGKRMGAAGLGWDVPLSYIYHDATAAHRRPESATQGHERWTLSLLGDSVSLLLMSGTAALQNRVWIAESGHPQLEMRETGDTNGLFVYDGEGNTYGFDRRDLTNGDNGTKLANGNLYLLTGITAPGNRAIVMDYAFSHPTLPGGGTGLSIDLNEVFYNYGGSGFNYKNRALLRYNASSTPLAITMLGTTPLVRMNTLSFIAVNGGDTRIRTYNFDYTDGAATNPTPKPDPDTGLPRLRAVTMTGQTGTPEAGVTLPVASYDYGSVVDPTSHQIKYERKMGKNVANDCGPACDVDNYAVALGTTTATLTSEAHDSHDLVLDLRTPTGGMDLNGDGRVDAYDAVRGLYSPGLPDNTASPPGFQFDNFHPRASALVAPLIHNVVLHGADDTSGSSPRLLPNFNDTLTQAIDINGDGRMDFIEVGDGSHNDVWIVHLNTPDPTDPSKIVWKTINLATANVRAAMNGTGLSFGRVPLSRVSTGPEAGYYHCWKSFRSGGVGVHFFWALQANSVCGTNIPAPNFRKTTLVEWQLIDVNGDGYPDFVYNASYVPETDTSVQPPPEPEAAGLVQPTHASFDMTDSHDVKVLINTAGTHLADGVDIFAPPVQLESGGTTGCGVARWQADASDPLGGTVLGGTVNETCAFADVNGDGIPDRVTTTISAGTTTVQAHLGTGDMSQPFSNNTVLTLPGAIATTVVPLHLDSGTGNPMPEACTASSTQFGAYQTVVLRDINGDGIPDYIRVIPDASGSTASAKLSLANEWRVSMGTGTGFAPEVSVTALPAPSGGIHTLTLGIEINQCHMAFVGSNPFQTSWTLGGMYDVDGDGQPEATGLSGSTPVSTTWGLQASASQRFAGIGNGVPQAGRLISIDNGYGAVTRITYESAKNDASTWHGVPGPEIVVAAISTTDRSNNVLMSPTRYAYGNISQYFDASADAFVSTGYLRSVELAGTVDGSPDAGIATITTGYGPQSSLGFSVFINDLLIGRTSDVVTLSSSSIGTDPWALLSTNIATDTRRIAGGHYTWGVRVLPDAIKLGNNTICPDVDPLIPTATTVSGDDMCVKNGFVFQTSNVAWRGTPGSDSQPVLSHDVVATDTEINIADVDDFGRVKKVGAFNDLNRGDDDQCVLTTYATPVQPDNRPRVLNRPFQRTVTDCGSTPKTLSKYTWEYDTTGGTKQPAGKVTNGFVTAHIVTRWNEDGNPLDVNGNPTDDVTKGDIRLFDAVVNSHGNTTSVKTTRDDGATRTVATTFDPVFDLVPMSTTVTATNADGTVVPSETSSVTRDPLTFDVLTTTDANGQQAGATFDGFGRILTSTITPTTGTAGTLSSTSYQGFAKGENGPLSVTQKVFTDPVANPSTAAGRTGTAYLDSLGRTDHTTVNLGADYSNQLMIVGQRTYDLEGRVTFAADPFLSTQSFANAYGTTYYYNADGTPSCFVRAVHNTTTAPSSPSATIATNEQNEVYPTCFKRTYEFHNFTEVHYAQGPNSLLAGSPQLGVKQLTAVTALGLPLVHSMVQTDSSGTITSTLDRMHLGYDHGGRQTFLRRFQDPNAVAKPVDTTWHYDSLGQVVELDEPAPNAPQFRSYDTWGELTTSGWCDSALGTCPTPATKSAVNRSSFAKFDALGRVTHREDRNGATAIAETVSDYLYDAGINNTTPPVTATFVLGRVAKATSPTSSTSFSYDPYGRINAEVFTDRTATSNNVYVEKHDYHGDGSASTLHLLLPDSTNFVDEHVDYSFDSAGRTRSANYTAGSTTQNLFTESGGIDVLGRLRHATYGSTVFDATFADTGRRLINDVKITTPSNKSREVSFATVAGTSGAVSAFDPVGRERVRTQLVNGTADPVKVNAYDTLGRLTTASVFTNSTLSTNREFTYDGLGNVLKQTDPNVTGTPGAVTLSYMPDDLDRVCGIGYGVPTAPSTCNVAYDAVGNITSEATRSGTPRTFAYEPSGHVRTISKGATTATFDYDALGALQQLVLVGTGETSQTIRHDKHFGGLIDQRDENGTPKLTRSFPIPGGLATRHGASGAWTFNFGEGRGMRYTTDASGEFAQDVDYQPYGETVPCTTPRICPAPGSATYTNEQWNEGNLLTAFGVNVLGARVYDPVIGRFLSRDPLFDAGNKFNPYAFAANDPINNSDPSGLGCGNETICPPDGCAKGVNCPSDSGGGGITPRGGSGTPCTHGCFHYVPTPKGGTPGPAPGTPGFKVAPSGPALPVTTVDVSVMSSPEYLAKINEQGRRESDYTVFQWGKDEDDAEILTKGEAARRAKNKAETEGCFKSADCRALLAIAMTESAFVRDSVSTGNSAGRGPSGSRRPSGFRGPDVKDGQKNVFVRDGNLRSSLGTVDRDGVRSVLKDTVNRGGKRISLLSGVHGWATDGVGGGFSDRANARGFGGGTFLAEDIDTAEEIMKDNPGVHIDVYDAADPEEFDSWVKDLSRGENVCVAGFCWSRRVLGNLGK